MAQKDKELLLKDLSARLPYGVRCTTKSSWNGIYTIVGYKDNSFFLDCPVYDEGDDEWMIESIVPYLRPMSSMTKEEEDEWCGLNIDPLLEAVGKRHTRVEDSMLRAKSQYKPTEWLNAHHFDYRGLIEKGLAIKASEEMYNLNENK